MKRKQAVDLLKQTTPDERRWFARRMHAFFEDAARDAAYSEWCLAFEEKQGRPPGRGWVKTGLVNARGETDEIYRDESPTNEQLAPLISSPILDELQAMGPPEAVPESTNLYVGAYDVWARSMREWENESLGRAERLTYADAALTMMRLVCPDAANALAEMITTEHGGLVPSAPKPEAKAAE